jgi:hypothetical protein
MSWLRRRRRSEEVDERPRLLHAVRMAFGFVWAAARRDFVISTIAEVAGALALAGLLVSGQRLVSKLTAEGGIADFSAVVPDAVALGVALTVSGLAAVFTRRYRWLVGEQVTRHVEGRSSTCPSRWTTRCTSGRTSTTNSTAPTCRSRRARTRWPTTC